MDWKNGCLLLVLLATACGGSVDDESNTTANNAVANNQPASNTPVGGDATCQEACQSTQDGCPAALGGLDVASCASTCEAAWSTASRNCLAAAAGCEDVAACDSAAQNGGTSNAPSPNNEPGNNAQPNNTPAEPCEPYIDSENEGCSSECSSNASIFIDGDAVCTSNCTSDDDCAGGSECNTDYNGGTCLYRCEGTGLSCPEGYLENTTTQCGMSGWCGLI